MSYLLTIRKKATPGLFENTLQEENFHWNLNLAISLMANLLQKIQILLIVMFLGISQWYSGFIIEIKKSKFANI